MNWAIEFAPEAVRELDKLDPQVSRRILKFLREFWKYRVGDYRIICKIENDRFVILVLRVGHRREIYR